MAEPEANPRTTPPLVTDAMVELLLVQVPPVVESERMMVLPAHTVAAPLMVPAVADVLTVIVFTAIEVLQLLVTA